MKIGIPFFLFFTLRLFSAPLTVGSDWELKNFSDQRDNPILINDNTITIFFVADMDASKVVHQVLETESAESLAKRNLTFISDIHKMPSLITRFIAIPKMKSYQYPMALIREEGISKDIPREKGKVTVFSLKKSKIVEIQFINEPDTLKKILDPPLKK